MYEIDKEKFGSFLAQLRKERGMIQKELAEKLYVTDKAVSKWERGLSLPDIALLQPLADILGVSVTELLSGQRIPTDLPMTVKEVEPLVTGALAMNIVMTAQEQAEQRARRRRWGVWYLASLLACGLEIWLLHGTGWLFDQWASFSLMPPIMAAGFGVYLIFFAMEKLPAFYDQYRLNFVSDGVFRLNVAGMSFNNRNWPHVLAAMRIWCCAATAGWVPLYCLARWAGSRLLPEDMLAWGLMGFTLFAILGGLFLPVAVVGKKYE